MITIPNVRSPEDSTGIVKRGPYFYASFSQDLEKKSRLIGTVGVTKPKEVRANRDSFYAGLVKEGATVAVRGTYKAHDPDRYLRHRKPWAVVIKAKVIAECDTKREAIEARDAYLGMNA